MTTNLGTFWKMARLAELSRSDHTISAGSSDSAPKELAVNPTRVPSGVRVVITVTPVANWLSDLRRARAIPLKKENYWLRWKLTKPLWRGW